MFFLLLDLKALPGGPLLTLPGGKVNWFVYPQPSLIQKLFPQAKSQAADFPVCHAEDFQIVPAVDGRHQDFEEFRLEIRRVILRVFLPELCPIAVQVLQDKGHDVSVLRSKDVSEFARPDAPQFDFVFTVCDQAANEECPAWEGQPVSGHWGMPDPVKVEGTNAEKALAFQQAYGALKHRIEAFVALPIETLDRIALQKAVDDIGRASPETLA